MLQSLMLKEAGIAIPFEVDHISGCNHHNMRACEVLGEASRRMQVKNVHRSCEISAMHILGLGGIAASCQDWLAS